MQTSLSLPKKIVVNSLLRVNCNIDSIFSLGFLLLLDESIKIKFSLVPQYYSTVINVGFDDNLNFPFLVKNYFSLLTQNNDVYQFFYDLFVNPSSQDRIKIEECLKLLNHSGLANSEDLILTVSKFVSLLMKSKLHFINNE